MKKLVVLYVAIVCLLLMTATCSASKVIYAPGTIEQIAAVTSQNSTGPKMAGMTSTFIYKYRGVVHNKTVNWVAKGPLAIARVANNSGALIKLSAKGNLWTLNVAKGVNLGRMVTSALPGNTVFDTTFKHMVGTSGSGLGQNLRILSPFSGARVDVTYRDLVTLQGRSPAGDLYGTMEIKFLALPKGAPYYFQLDTDAVSPVPIPSGLILICSGLLCLFGIRQHKRKFT